MDTGRQTNRWFYHADCLLKEAEQCYENGLPVDGSLVEALEEGAAALIERGLSSLVSEFLASGQYVGNDWRTFLVQHYSNGGELYRLYAALLEPRGELHVLTSKLGRLLDLPGAQPAQSGMIQSDVSAIPLRMLLKELKTLVLELRQVAEEW